MCTKIGFKARKKNFFFLGEKHDRLNMMLKLGESLEEAFEQAKAHPGLYKPGKNGWVSLDFPLDHLPPDGLMERWIQESFRMLAPKTLVKAWAAEQ